MTNRAAFGQMLPPATAWQPGDEQWADGHSGLHSACTCRASLGAMVTQGG